MKTKLLPQSHSLLLVELTFPVALGRDRVEHKKQVLASVRIARGGQRQAVRLLVGFQTNVSVQTHP